MNIHLTPKQRLFLIFTSILGLTFLLNFLIYELITTEEFYYNNLYNYPEAEEMAMKANNYDEIRIAQNVLKIATSIFVTSIAIYFVNLLSDKGKLKFGLIFSAVSLGHLSFLVFDLIKFVNFQFLDYPNSLTDFNQFSFISAYDFIAFNDPYWLRALTSKFDIYQAGFIFLAAYQIKLSSDKTFGESLNIIVISYIPLLFLYILGDITTNFLFFN
jgi:hypothetical protein